MRQWVNKGMIKYLNEFMNDGMKNRTKRLMIKWVDKFMNWDTNHKIYMRKLSIHQVKSSFVFLNKYEFFLSMMKCYQIFQSQTIKNDSCEKTNSSSFPYNFCYSALENWINK